MRQELFNYFSEQHGINLLDSEVNEIVKIVFGEKEYLRRGNEATEAQAQPIITELQQENERLKKELEKVKPHKTKVGSFEVFKKEMKELMYFDLLDEETEIEYLNDWYSLFKDQKKETVKDFADWNFKEITLDTHDFCLKYKLEYCDQCDGVGTVEGGKFLETKCTHCEGLGVVKK